MNPRPLAALLLALPLLPVPARAADDLATVRARVQAAMQATRSFVVTTTAITGYGVTTTFVAPDRFHSSLTYGGATREVVLIGTVAYVSEDGKTFRKMDAPPEVIAAQAQLRDVPVEHLVPDKMIGSRMVGRFTTTASGPQKDQLLTCDYDKATYRINMCSNAGMTLTFSRYDDPANAVTVPANVVTAPKAHP